MSTRLSIALAIGAVALSVLPVGPAAADRIAFDRSTNQQPGSEANPRLWTVQPNGKRLHRLKTSSKVSSPDQSRDGRKLVWFHSERKVEFVVGDRNARHPRVVYRKSTANTPRWSPTGRALAFNQGTSTGVERVGVLNLRSRKVDIFNGLSLGGWSPDGRTIVGPSASGTTRIPCPPPLPPNGPIPCFGRLFSLNVLDTQTGAIRKIFTGPVPSTIYGASWSPDGALIAFDQSNADSDNADGIFQLWVIRPDGSGLRQVTTIPRGGSSPSWSPDGRRLAFLAEGAGRKKYVATIGLDGSGLKRLTRDEYHLGAPDWGP